MSDPFRTTANSLPLVLIDFRELNDESSLVLSKKFSWDLNCLTSSNLSLEHRNTNQTMLTDPEMSLAFKKLVIDKSMV